MKNLVLIISCFIVLFSCNTSQKKKTDIHNQDLIISKLNIFLDNWHKAASEANYKDYFNKMDSISIFIGTDATENWTKPQFETYSKPHFDKGRAWSFKVLERNLYISNSKNFVWFDENLETKSGTFRGSGVVEKKGKDWKIKHYVLSVPIPNDDISSVAKIIRKKDSVFRSKFK